MRSIASSLCSRRLASALRSTTPSRRCHAWATTGSPSTCIRRVTMPARTRITASPPPLLGSRYGQGGRTAPSRQTPAGAGPARRGATLPVVSEDVDVDEEGAAGDDALLGSPARQPP